MARHRTAPGDPAPWLLICAAVLALAACSFDGSGVAPPPPAPNADPTLGCSGGCHGDQNTAAPPQDLAGNTETTRVGVGAHRSHLAPAPTKYRKVLCQDCHQVPIDIAAPGHMDTPAPAELLFGAVATSDNSPATWDGETCTIYCHGATLAGGALTTPSWTVVDGTQSACGNCHGFPPPLPHPEDTDCGVCHTTIQPGTSSPEDATFLDPASHINGVLDVQDVAGEKPCDACHGSDGNPAPPLDLGGGNDRAAPGVGAHREHLGQSGSYRELLCSDCHVVPQSEADPGHIDGDDRAELIFGDLNSDAQYDSATATCQNLYCHGDGAFLLGEVVWTDDLVLGCDSCHDDGNRAGRGELSGEHDRHVRNQSLGCNECHGAVVDQGLGFVDPERHIDGVRQVDIPSGGVWDAAQRTCDNVGCHADEDVDDPTSWDSPTGN